MKNEISMQHCKKRESHVGSGGTCGKNATGTVESKKDRVSSQKRKQHFSDGIENKKSRLDKLHPENNETSTNEEKGAFSNFRISSDTIDRLIKRGIKYLFPIQAKTFDYVYDGLDVIGHARTGTGKTLSFTLPIVEKLRKKKLKQSTTSNKRPIKALALAPTRELALQITDNFKAITDEFNITCIYGGVSYMEQENNLRNGIDILVGTPGRIKDHIERGNIVLSKLKFVVLDEVDRMLDMGFCDVVEEILSYAYIKDRHPQTLLFSATVPSWVLKTVDKYMASDKKVIDLIGSDVMRTSKTVEHKIISCPYHERAATIGDLVKVYGGDHARTIIFSPTKKEANELALSSVLKQDVQVLHGDIQQAQREVTLKGFREGIFPCLVATDVAARGLDIPEVDLVIQCEPPKDLDTYIHRAGRTGRANRAGACITFYKPIHQDRLKSIEQHAGIKFCRIGAPQLQDIITATTRDTVKSLDAIPDEVAIHFEKIAQTLIEERGATKVLSAALAQISGYTSIKRRSLLSSREGFTTYVMRSSREFRSVSYMWKIIEQELPPEVKASVRGMRMCRDKMGVVFDVPENFDKIVKDCWSDNGNITLEIATTLPELLDSSISLHNSATFSGGYNNDRFVNGKRERTSYNGRGNQQRVTDNGSSRGFRRRPMNTY